MLGRSGGQSIAFVALIVAGSMFYFLPGVAYIVFAVYLRQHRFWALIAALVLSVGEALFFLVGTVVLVWAFFNDGYPWGVLIPVALLCVVLLALLLLVYFLARSFAAIRLPPFGREERGFEPLGVRPVVPVGAGGGVGTEAPPIAAPGSAGGPDATASPHG